ncbi:MAG: hypothetical protein KIS66_00680 [Fimbriimonadaceae bacterium]|nr:hypothetical protein [Fimbriimonadaceae bacterium]
MHEPLVELKGCSRRERGPTFDAAFFPGETVAVIEPDRVVPPTLELLRGTSTFRRGTVERRGRVSHPPGPPPRRRESLQTYCRSLLGDGDPTRIAAALTELGLWEQRSARATDHEALAPVLAALLGPEEIVALPLTLDRLDPWATRRVWRALSLEVARGRTVLLHTHRLELAAACDRLLVGDRDDLRFVGRPSELPESAPAVVRVRTAHAPDVRALVEPFAIQIKELPDGMEFVAPKGQELAARLLIQGYGDVEYAVLRRPPFEEVLLDLLDQ